MRENSFSPRTVPPLESSETVGGGGGAGRHSEEHAIWQLWGLDCALPRAGLQGVHNLAALGPELSEKRTPPHGQGGQGDAGEYAIWHAAINWGLNCPKSIWGLGFGGV